MFTLVLHQTKSAVRPTLEVCFWALALGIISRYEIPIVPVPITLQTFGVFLIGLFLTPKKAFSAALLYLFFVSLGFPFLSKGAANPLWLLGASAGYLCSFPFATMIISRMKSITGLALGQLLIITVGALWLTIYIGYYKAFIYGFLIFIPTGAVKIIAAYAVYKGYAYARKLY